MVSFGDVDLHIEYVYAFVSVSQITRAKQERVFRARASACDAHIIKRTGQGKEGR